MDISALHPLVPSMMLCCRRFLYISHINTCRVYSVHIFKVSFLCFHFNSKVSKVRLLSNDPLSGRVEVYQFILRASVKKRCQYVSVVTQTSCFYVGG